MPLSPVAAKVARVHAELARSPDPQAGGAFARFSRALGYPFLGWRFISAHPALYRYCIIPFILNLLIMTAIGVGLWHYYPDLVAWIWRRPEGLGLRVLWYVLYVFILLAVLVLGYALFFILQALLASPFNDLLSEKTEELLAGHKPLPFSLARFLRNAVVTVAHESMKLLLLIAILAPLWLVCLFIPGIGSILFAVLGGAVSAFFLGYDYHDYALARRRFPFGRKWGLLTHNFAFTLGFGTTVSLMLLVPVLGLFFPPFAAVGGTIACLDYERYGRLPPPPRPRPPRG
ncbi:MAG TPA: EI24 domain-containing protein [Polyangia bacterium]